MKIKPSAAKSITVLERVSVKGRGIILVVPAGSARAGELVTEGSQSYLVTSVESSDVSKRDGLVVRPVQD